MKECKKSYPEKTLKMSTVIVKSATSILKSVAFNICIFALGIVLGYSAFYTKLQADVMVYSTDECIKLIEKKLNEMAELDKKYTQSQEDIKLLLRKIQVSLLAK